jgi:predicted amidohydrolase YtcJ
MTLRKGFLMAWVLLVFTLSACQPEADSKPLDATVAADPAVLIHNARIYTFDEANSMIDNGALVFSAEGSILALGESDAMMAAYSNAQSHDMQGRTILPGLIDAHGHLAGTTGYAASLTQANLVGAESKQEVLQRLRDFEATLGEEDWLVGFGWDQNDWPEKEFPSRADLDKDFADRPVWLERIDGHAAWVNSAALSVADRDFSGDWNPQGGDIHRDANQQATGIFIDQAMSFVGQQVPPVTPERLDSAMDQAISNLLAVGITSVHDMGINRQAIESLQSLIKSGRLPIRVYAFADGLNETMDWLCKSGFVNDPSGFLVMRGVKLYGDGALGSRGAALLSDYTDEPGNSGLIFNDDATVRSHVSQALSCGLQVAIHAIGDRANRQALDAFEAGLSEYPDNEGRHRIEHVQILAPEDIPRLAQWGIIASMQPTHATSDMYWAEERLGIDRARAGAYVWRSLADADAHLALGSDFPVENINPMHGIFAAVSRQDLKQWPQNGWFPEQALNRIEAIRGFTIGAAYAAFMEQEVGSLEPGKKADFIVLDQNIMQVAVEDIPGLQVLQTWVNGKKVFDLGEKQTN